MYFMYLLYYIIPTGKYYLVDAGYPNPMGYLGPYKEVSFQEAFNHAHL